MAISVRIPTPLRSLTQGKDEVQADGGNVGEVIAHLETQFPGLRDRLLDEKGVRRFINLYVNDEDVRFLEALKTSVKEGDTMTIVPAIAGG
ncbi:MAG: MoaD/ThiS family protein [Deltaproteobacteria bacterium]